MTTALVIDEPMGVRQVPTNGSRMPNTENPMAWQIAGMAASGMMYPV